jgi:hypothetical protein
MIFYGQLIISNVALQPYDFVQVLVRGKGGMQNEEAGATTPEGKLDEEIQGATGGEEREEDNQTLCSEMNIYWYPLSFHGYSCSYSFYFVVFSFVNCSWKHEAPVPYQ